MTKGALSPDERAPFRCSKSPFQKLIKPCWEGILAKNKGFLGSFEILEMVILVQYADSEVIVFLRNFTAEWSKLTNRRAMKHCL